MKKLVVLGAGAQGAPGATAAIRMELADEILLCDNNVDLLRSVSDKISSPHLRTQVVNAANDASLQNAFQGAGAVINLLNPIFNRHVMESCLAVGAHYVDTAMGEMEDLDLKKTDNTISRMLRGQEFPLDKPFKEKGLTCLMGCGSAPGVMNVVGRYTADKFDVLEGVKFLFGRKSLLPDNPDAGWRPSWNPTRSLWGYSVKPYIYRGNGVYEEQGRFANYEEVEFHEPVGVVPLVSHHHPEQISFPYFYNRKMTFCDFKFHIDWAARTLIACGFDDPDRRVTVDGVEVSPRAVLMKMVQQPVGNFLNETEESAAQPLTSVVGGGVVATGIINGKKMMLKTTFDPNFYNTAEERVSLFRRFGACNIYVSFPALVGAVLCIEGKVSHGVIGSECLLPQDFFGKCAEYGVDIELHESCREID